MTTPYRTIAAGEFKTHCLRVMDRVRARREEVVITKNGTPVAKLVPVDDPGSKDVFGCLVGELELVGDILAPVDRAEDWEAS